MKSLKTMTLVMAMVLFSMTAIQGAQKEKVASRKSDLKVVCSPELESLAKQLVSNYSREYDATLTEVSTVGNEEVSGTLHEGTVALVNKECVAALEGDQYYKMVIGRDAIVPLMNSNNPQRDLILEHGISAEQFARIYTATANITWGEVLGVSDSHPVCAYVPGKIAAKNYLAEFLQVENTGLTGLVAMQPEEMLRKLGNDPGAIGFCTLSSLIDMENSGVDMGVALVPIDMNGDGRIGTFEDIYDSSSMLSHAIFVGRFPKSLYSRIYAVTVEQSATQEEMGFMQWMMNGGQETLAKAGILKLGYGERASALERLAGYDKAIASVTVKSSPDISILLVAGLLLLLGLLVLIFASIAGNRRETPSADLAKEGGTAAFPGGLFFDRTHTWAFMEKSGRVRIGIDDFLQNVTGTVTRVVMKQPGEQIKRGDSFMTLIQNGKRLEIKSPVSGIVEEQNSGLLSDASLLNSDPYAAGWVLMIRPLNWIFELKSFFMGELYADWLKAEAARLKAFFTSVLRLQNNLETTPVLQDGGEITGSVLESYGPEVWEEFQKGFINCSR